MSDVAAVTVAIPTVGRPSLLRDCLESLARCSPRPAEILVIDQSEGNDVAVAVASFAELGARCIRAPVRSIAHARNLSLKDARHEVVLFTDDDCTVDQTWVATATRHMRLRPRALITGRVLAGEGADTALATIEEDQPRDFTGDPHPGVLFTGNMAVSRSEALYAGGFDERFRDAGEDTDFCYRWIKQGRQMRYEPDMLVWHQQWRTRHEVERVYVGYAYANGLFYAKHLCRGDLLMLRWIFLDLYVGSRSLAGRYLRRKPRWAVSEQGILAGLPRGLLRGWSLFRDDGSRRMTSRLL
jgi:GT2 family glycosyltransferase